MDSFYLFIGCIVLIGGLYGIISDYHYSKYGLLTEGRVIKIIGKWSASGGGFSYLYYPLVQFKTESNQELQLRLEVGATLPLYRKGQLVKIIYYQEKIHPTGKLWKIFYWAIFLVGLTISLYQIIELVNHEVWESFGVFWRILVRLT